ncbi:MAG: hypothetical protein ACJA0N_000724 [Pseudohongiellaceae bacterium]|jgi:hypothetical protein
MDRKYSVDEILDKAAHQHITAEELDILVTKTREISQAREKELATIKSLLQELESHLQH